MSAPVLILHAPGSNRDGDLAFAFASAGGAPHVVPLTQLRHDKVDWKDFALLALPGGFSYGDALGAGRLWALDLETWFQDCILDFVANGKPVIGICNGFQALVKSGVLPSGSHKATLTFNASGQFECRWVNLSTNPSNSSPWLIDMPFLACPVAHGEGRFLTPSKPDLPPEQVAFSYALPDGSPAGGSYPYNPNGSTLDIAGITNADGNVLGLMPHPEDHVHPFQHPQWTRGLGKGMANKLFENGLRMALMEGHRPSGEDASGTGA